MKALQRDYSQKSDTYSYTLEPKVSPAQPETSRSMGRMIKAERFNFLSLTLILGTIVAVYLFFTDSHFKNILVNAWKSTFGKLTLPSSGFILLIVGILLVVVFFRKK